MELICNFRRNEQSIAADFNRQKKMKQIFEGIFKIVIFECECHL